MSTRKIYLYRCPWWRRPLHCCLARPLQCRGAKTSLDLFLCLVAPGCRCRLSLPPCEKNILIRQPPHPGEKYFSPQFSQIQLLPWTRFSQDSNPQPYWSPSSAVTTMPFVQVISPLFLVLPGKFAAHKQCWYQGLQALEGPLRGVLQLRQGILRPLAEEGRDRSCNNK